VNGQNRFYNVGPLPKLTRPRGGGGVMKKECSKLSNRKRKKKGSEKKTYTKYLRGEGGVSKRNYANSDSFQTRGT